MLTSLGKSLKIVTNELYKVEKISSKEPKIIFVFVYSPNLRFIKLKSIDDYFSWVTGDAYYPLPSTLTELN